MFRVFIKQIINLFYPEVCAICENHLTDNEKVICTICQMDLPLAQYSLVKDNAVEQSFYGRIPLVAATAYLKFKKLGKAQELIHQLKYKNRQDVGEWIGEFLGKEMLDSERFKACQVIVKVPLHPKKQRKRGYNQLNRFAIALSENLNIPIIDQVLVKTTVNQSQTYKNRMDRLLNAKHQFSIQQMEKLKGKHILLIDDVITTGATIEACSKALSQIPDIKISLATIAYTI